MISLDILRGITIGFMIMVNNNGDWGHSWWFMEHSEWNGLTPTDLVFPTFLFVVGVSLVFSFASRLERHATRSSLMRHVVQRAAIIFLLGLLFNALPFFPIHDLRIYGVLQRIALCYLAVGLFYIWKPGVRGLAVLTAVCLIGYWILMRWVPVPGFGIPGRDIPLLDPNANLAAWLDRHLMAGSHLYEKTRDPEGLLSTMPALATTLLGILTGIWLRTRRSMESKALGLAAFAIGCLATGYVWSIWFPLNKKLWTSSYVLVSAGWSLCAFAILFWCVEVKGWRGRWTWPWLVLGMNAIAAYCFAELLGICFWAIRWYPGGKLMNPQLFIFNHFFIPVGNIYLASFLYAVWYALICFIPMWLLYRKRIFLKI